MARFSVKYFSYVAFYAGKSAAEEKLVTSEAGEGRVRMRVLQLRESCGESRERSRKEKRELGVSRLSRPRFLVSSISRSFPFPFSYRSVVAFGEGYLMRVNVRLDEKPTKNMLFCLTQATRKKNSEFSQSKSSL